MILFSKLLLWSSWLVLSNAATECTPTVLMKRDDKIENGQTLKNGIISITQGANGNLEVRKDPDDLVWESGVDGPTDYTYYTMIQGDSNLITWRELSSNGRSVKSVAWKSETVNPDGFYYFVLECPESGGGVAIYKGHPEDGGAPVWKLDALPLAPTTPKVDLSLLCDYEVFMERNDILQEGEAVSFHDVFIMQKSNGNLEVRRGNPGSPGGLVWESAYSGSTDDSYYTKFQGDSNIVTWSVTSDGNKSAVWQSKTVMSPEDLYFFVRVCEEHGGGVAIYQGQPNESGQLVWGSGLMADSPSLAGTLAPSKAAGAPIVPSTWEKTGAPTMAPIVSVEAPSLLTIDRDGNVHNVEKASNSGKLPSASLGVLTTLFVLCSSSL